MKILIAQDRCVGAGQCVLAAPDVFDQRDDDGVVALLDEVPPEAQWAASRQAASLCPAAAITIHED